MAATVKAEFVVQRDDQETFEVPAIDPFEGAVPIIRRHVADRLEPGTKFVLRKPDGGAAFNTDNELASYLGTASPPTVVVDIGHTLPFSITGADGVPCSFEVENVQFGTRVSKLKELVCKVGTSPPHNFRFISDWSMLLLVDPNAIPKDKHADFVSKFCIPASAASAATEPLQRLKDRAELDEDFFCIFHGKSKHSLFIHNSAPASAAAASFSGAQILGAAACPQPDQSAFSSGPVGDVTTRMQELNLRGGRKFVFVRDKYGSESCVTVEFSVGETGSELLRRCVARFVPGITGQLEEFSLTAMGDWRCDCLEQRDGNWILNSSRCLDVDFAAAANKHENYLVLVRSESSPPMQATSFVNIEGIGAQPEKRIAQSVNVKAGMPAWDVLSRLRLVFGPSVRSGGEYDLVLPDEILRPHGISDEDWDRFQSLRLLPGATLDRRFLFSKEFIQVFSLPQGNCLKACVLAEPYIADLQTRANAHCTLYNRVDSAYQMFQSFLSSAGRSAPSLGQSFGAGKSMLCYRFREFAQTPEFLNQLESESADPRFLHSLLGAVFVSVKFMSGDGFADVDESNIEDKLKVAEKKLGESLLKSTGLHCETRDEREVMRKVVGRKILLHFDEIQCFENSTSAKTLYRFWEWTRNISEELGSLYMLSGRSQWLNFMGQKKHVPGKPENGSLDFVLVPIILPLISESSIQEMLRSRRFDPELETLKQCAHVFKRFTAGVPRFLFLAGRFFSEGNPETLRAKFADPQDVQRATLCGEFNIGLDRTLWEALLAAAWAQFPLPKNSSIKIRGLELNICDAISQAGFYFEEADGNNVVVQAPLWSFVVNKPELARLAASYNSGDRFEEEAIKVFALRLELSHPKCWSDLGLSCLEAEKVPFFFNTIAKTKLPKVQKKPVSQEQAEFVASVVKKDYAASTASSASASASASASSASAAADTGRKTFAYLIDRGKIGVLYKALKIGAFHHFFPKSGREDGVVRVSEDAVLCVQYKNFLKPISLSKVKDEASKCSCVAGFTVFLLIICSAGHVLEDETQDLVLNHCGVKTIVLCRKSVINFLGLHLVTSSQSDTILSERERPTQTFPPTPQGKKAPAPSPSST